MGVGQSNSGGRQALGFEGTFGEGSACYVAPGGAGTGPTPTGWHRRGLDIPPEITGHWQVPGSSSRISLVEMVELDCLHVANWSVWVDVQLLPRTIPFVLRGNGV